MRVGVPTEIKVHEYRVGLTPSAVREYVARGHKVLVQSGAGAGIMATDEAYKKAGAKIAKTAEEVFAKSDMIVKVKEPQAVERRRCCVRPDPVHLSAPRARPGSDPGSGRQRRDLHRLRNRDRRPRRATAVRADVASGRPAVDSGRRGGLERARGGRGILLGGVPGVAPAKVVVIGGGVVGENAIYTWRWAWRRRDRRSTAMWTVLRRLGGIASRRGAQDVYSTKAASRRLCAASGSGDRRGAGGRRRGAQAGDPRHGSSG
jgi:alanine dehydrogenase